MPMSLMPTYARLPVTFSHGAGCWLFDDQGERYLDALSGIAVCGLGHAHPAVTAAIQAQAGRLLHTSNLYQVGLQDELGEILTTHAGMDRVFFANSGAEANEAAIKLARLWGHQHGMEEPAVIVLEHSFHGRTLATLSATGNSRIQHGFAPLVDGFVRAPHDDLTALTELATQHTNIVAVLVEPIQGEGGIRIPQPDYLAGIRQLCNEQNWLLIADEIQSGMGRTGTWFACQQAGIQPDVMTLAKALGNGVPIGACLARGAAAELFSPGSHGSTFGGNPLVCAAALATCQTLQAEDLPTRAAALGTRLLADLRQALANCPGIREIRGKGLMIGIELDRPCGELVQQALADHLLINVTAGQVIRLLPPLILSDAEADQLVTQLSQLIHAFCTSSSC
ncbi:MAG: aspartate aminotransferase family protein [Pseudomonadota bacterium]